MKVSQLDPSQMNRSDGAVLGFLVAHGNDIDGGDAADPHRGDGIAVEKRAPSDAARPHRLAAHPEPPPEITNPARAVTSPFPRMGEFGRTLAFGGQRQARSLARRPPDIRRRRLEVKR